ncbi:MAG: 2-amino-4-hydroxy-6-hydroxymethyldihydropteridine diphosphokinase [Desulfobacca sp.]|nr:2-amino-4-hydroxy-6-hydroxymethyldihydropteridine diphosphokinase [Desulfobacca sp.]
MEALCCLRATPGQTIIKVSSWYSTQPIGLEDPEWFINGVVLLETSFLPDILLAKLLEIEVSLGRERTVKWGPRIIDLDLLSYDQLIMRSVELTLPHPFLEKRRFVLEPMAEIAPDYVHPVFQKTITELRDELGIDGQNLIKLPD